MKLEVEFSQLRELARRMGAELSSWKPSYSLNERAGLLAELEEGKEIPIEQVDTAFGSLLEYKGEQVILYIKDTRQDRETLLFNIGEARRYHVAECRTLDEMRRQGRFERYVVTTRKDGNFLVEATDPATRDVEEIEAPLAVCKNCLRTLDWKGFAAESRSGKDNIWRSFYLEDFFAEFATFFFSKPQHTDQSAPPGGYGSKWSQLAKTMKTARSWRCDTCGVDLSNDRHLLHCHHRNGVVSDNRPVNIAVLCLLCHSEQPAHQRLRPSAKDRVRIELLRRQGAGQNRKREPK